MSKRYFRGGFTLVELLVVISIIAVLSSIALAVVSGAREEADAAVSLSNLRQMGIACALYAAEHDGKLPQSSHQGPSQAWTVALKSYASPKVFRSPLDRTSRSISYAINDFVTTHPYGAEDLDFSRMVTQPAPAETLLMAVLEENAQNSDHFHFADPEGGYSAAFFQQEVWVKLIRQSSHYLFLDGHVAALAWSEIQNILANPLSRFIRPDGQNKLKINKTN